MDFENEAELWPQWPQSGKLCWSCVGRTFMPTAALGARWCELQSFADLSCLGSPVWAEWCSVICPCCEKDWINKRDKVAPSTVTSVGEVFSPETHREFYQAQCEGHSSQTLSPLPCWTEHLMVSFQGDQRDHHIVFEWCAPSRLCCGQIR